MIVHVFYSIFQFFLKQSSENLLDCTNLSISGLVQRHQLGGLRQFLAHELLVFRGNLRLPPLSEARD